MTMHSNADAHDDALSRVASHFESQRDLVARFVQTIRRAFDEVIDGPRTGRVRYDQLEKTEKTYLGTKVEVLLRYEFKLVCGERLDYVIDGVEVDCKFSPKRGGWTIPPEAVGEVCLLVNANERLRELHVSLIRCHDSVLNPGM